MNNYLGGMEEIFEIIFFSFKKKKKKKNRTEKEKERKKKINDMGRGVPKYFL